MLTKEELMQIRDSLKECDPDVEVFDWGPSLYLAQKRKEAALALLNREIKPVKQNG